MAERPKERLWIRVVETHAAKVWCIVILTLTIGFAVDILALGAVWNTIANHDVNDLGSNFNTLLASVLSVGMGGIIGFLSGQAAEQTRRAKPGEFPGDEDLILDIENPHEIPARTAESEHVGDYRGSPTVLSPQGGSRAWSKIVADVVRRQPYCRLRLPVSARSGPPPPITSFPVATVPT